MRIINLRPAGDPVGQSRMVARFDCQVTEHLRLNNLALCRHGDGFRVWPPKSLGVNSAYLHPTLAGQIATAAADEFYATNGGLKPDDYFRHAG